MSDTDKSFDDYFNSNFEDGLSSPSKYILRFTYEAGQQSKQDEVDEMQKRIEVVLDHVVNHGGYDDLTHIINILKGENRE